MKRLLISVGTLKKCNDASLFSRKKKCYAKHSNQVLQNMRTKKKQNVRFTKIITYLHKIETI